MPTGIHPQGSYGLREEIKRAGGDDSDYHEHMDRQRDAQLKQAQSKAASPKISTFKEVRKAHKKGKQAKKVRKIEGKAEAINADKGEQAAQTYLMKKQGKLDKIKKKQGK